MTSARFTKLLLLCGLALTLAPWSVAQQVQNQPLQLTVRQQNPEAFQAYLKNTGNKPLQLSFGKQFAEWEAMPAIHLILTDAQAKTVSLDMKYHYAADPNTTSRLIESRAMLQTGQIFSFPIVLQDYLRQPLAPGQYTVQAVYIGENRHAQSAHAVPEYWTSKVTSNTLPLTIPENASEQTQNASPVQLTIQQTSPKPTFRVDLHNAGAQPVQFFLDMQNGGISLSLADTTGNTMSLRAHFDLAAGDDARKRSMGGMLPGLISVMLQSGETHSFPIDLANYASPEQWDMSLAPGQYTLKANTYSICPSYFIEQPPPNSYPCWKGSLTSTPLPFTIPQRPVQ